LKSARIPEGTEDYWRDFPRKVTARLHWQSAPATARRGNQPNDLLIWSLGLASLFVVMGLFFAHRPARPSAPADGQLAAARKCYHEMEALFPNQVAGIVFDQQGPRMIIADRPNVPSSTPFYLKICGPGGCESFVTFSGQQVHFNGENCEVLADAQDRVVLVGNHQVWSSADSGDAIRIEATPLEAAL
jgi:hypothetical protein